MKPSTRIAVRVTTLVCAILAPIMVTASVPTATVHPDYLIDSWTTADGLPVNDINAVHVGTTGFVWLATFDGLVRFDGHRFVVFNSSSNPELPSNRLITLMQADDGLLWLTTEQMTLASFDGARFRIWGTADGLPDAHVTVAPLRLDGGLWVGTLRGAAMRSGDGFRGIGAQNAGAIGAILPLAGGRCWIGTEDGLFEFRDGRLINRYRASDGLPAAPVLALGTDRRNRLWIGTREGVVRLVDGRINPTGVDESVRRIETGDDGSVAMLATAANHVWRDGRITREARERSLANGRERLLRIAPDGAHWRNRLDALLREGEVVLRSPCTIKDYDFDASGALWLASACNGLQRLRGRSIQALTELAGEPLGSVYGMAESGDGTLWMATLEHGLAALQADGSARWYGKNEGLGDANLGTLLAEADGTLWVGQIGLCHLREGRCEQLAGLPAGLQPDQSSVRAIYRDDQGALWVGARSGLWRSYKGHWSAENKRAGMAPFAGVRSIAPGHDGSLWFGTLSDGLYRRDGTGHYAHYGVADGLSSLAIRDLHVDRDSYLWVATENRGLCRSVEPAAARSRFACIGRAQGLWSDSLHRILADPRDELWLNSNHGVFHASRDAFAAVMEGRAERVYPRVYTERDGLPSREGNGGVQGAGLVLSDGRIALPTQNGVALIDPLTLDGEVAPARAVIESVSLPNGRQIEARSAPVAPPRGERTLSIRFTGLSPTLTEPLYFRYRLLPDAEWIDLGAVRTLTLSRLPPGRYTLELVALNSGGHAGPPARQDIDLASWPHETATFRLGLPILLLLGLVAALWRQRIVARQRQGALERTVAERTADLRRQQSITEAALGTVSRQRNEIAALAESRTLFFANVSHELRTPLTLLSGPIADLTAGRAPSPELGRAMRRNVTRLERLVNQLLDLERIDAGRFPLRTAAVDFAALVRESMDAFAALAVREEIEFTAVLPQTPLLLCADAEQLLRVVGNLLSNAIKFTPAGGRLRVNLYDDGHRALLAVHDSGPGVPPEWRERIFDRFSQMGSAATAQREGAGLGLALCRQVLDLHGGHIHVTPSELGGACFMVTLSLGVHASLAAADGHSATAALSALADKSEAVSTAAAGPADADHASGAALASSAAAPTGYAPDTTGANASARPLVLIAEDNADLRLYLAEVLGRVYRVATAVDGDDALRQARADAPDAVVSDVVMPQRDGFSLAHALRADPVLGGVPLVFLTARAGDRDRIAGLDGGADHYLTKPFDADVLLAHVAAALQTCRRLQQQFARRAGTPPEVAAGHDFASRLSAYLDRHGHEPDFDFDRLAAALHLSRSSLQRHCQADLGTTPAEQLRRYRLQRAHDLLVQGAGSVSEIAYAVGYGNLSSFSRAYREHHGVAPSQHTR